MPSGGPNQPGETEWQTSASGVGRISHSSR